jgi:hypothetical protein
MSPHAVQVSCVAENRADWYRRVETLAITLRNFGGQLASARFVAHFVGGVDYIEGRLLRELGVELQGVPRYPSPQPTTNKLRMFEDFAWNSDAELLVALDCDTVVVGDFLDQAKPGAVAAVAARTSPLDAGGWEQLLGRLGLPVSTTPTIMFETGEAVPAPYMNSGVLLVPRSHAEALVTGWTKYVDRFTADSQAGVQEPWTRYMMDQVALACAFLDGNIPVQELGLDVNLSTALNAAARREREEVLRGGSAGRVKLLHYHRHISDDGRLLRTDKGSPLNDVIDHVNRVVESRAGAARRRVTGKLPAGGKALAARFLPWVTP